MCIVLKIQESEGPHFRLKEQREKEKKPGAQGEQR